MRLFGFVTLSVLSLAIAGYAVAVYLLLPLGAAVHPDMRPTLGSHGAAIYVHIFASVFAMALGPLQFWTKLRTARPVLHRWSGRLYLGVGVLLGGLSGLLVAFNAFGGVVARAGFACLAVAWLFSGFRAYQAIAAHDVVAHRRWMVRNFSLTFAAVMLRLWLPALVISGVSFEAAYPVVAWLCWVPNVVLAERLFNKNAPPRSMVQKLAAVAAVLSVASSAHAQRQDPSDAAAAVTRLYQDFAAEAMIDDPDLSGDGLFLQPREILAKYLDGALVELVLEDRECARRSGSVCNLDFSPIWDSQDPLGATVKISGSSEPSRVLVEVRYFDNPDVRRLVYRLVESPAGWRVTDIEYSYGSLVNFLQRRP